MRQRAAPREVPAEENKYREGRISSRKDDRGDQGPDVWLGPKESYGGNKEMRVSRLRSHDLSQTLRNCRKSNFRQNANG